MRNDIDAEMIMAIFTALINIDTLKEIGLQYFPQVLEYLTKFIMEGLIFLINRNISRF